MDGLVLDLAGLDGELLAGWPRAVAHPRLPQIRACPTQAPGSSDNGLAARRYTLRLAPVGPESSVGDPNVRVSSGSLRASSAILRCRVEMTSRPKVPVIYPSASSTIRSAASHPPGPLGRVPRPHRYLSADSDFSPPVAPRFVSFARPYHRFAPLRSPGVGRFPEGLDYFYRGVRAASSRWRWRDLPGSWATLAYMPRSSTPADRRPQATTGPAMWSSAI